MASVAAEIDDGHGLRTADDPGVGAAAPGAHEAFRTRSLHAASGRAVGLALSLSSHIRGPFS